jgi:hypothetical protein
VKLVRVIPVLITLARGKPTVLVRASVFAVLDVIKTVVAIPPELDRYFDYLKTELNSLSLKNGNTAFVFNEFLPYFAVEILRLSRKSTNSFILALTNVLTRDNTAVFKVFSQTLRSMRFAGRSRLLESFLPSVLVALNHPAIEFPMEILQILIAFYSDGTFSELREYAEQCQGTVLPIFNDIIGRRGSEQILIVIFEFMELVLRRKIVHSSVAFEWSSYITKFSSSPNSVIQYWILRLMRVFPEKARWRMSFAFVFEAPQRTKSVVRPSGPRPGCRAKEEEKLIDFEDIKKIQFHPRFLSSSHSDSVRIDHLFECGMENRFFLIDRRRRIRSVVLPCDQDPVFKDSPLSPFPESPTSSCSLLTHTEFALGYNSGRLNRYNIEKATQIDIGSFASPDFPTAMSALSENSILVGSFCGSTSLFDFRETQSTATRTMTCDISSSVASISVWPNSHIVAGVGLRHGLVAFLDLRMWATLWSSKTQSVSQVLPMSSEIPTLSYFVMNPNAVQIVSEARVKLPTSPRVTLRYQTPALFRLALPYLGGAVVVDDLSASFLSANDGCPNVRLLDRTTKPLSVRKKGKSTGVILPQQDECTQSLSLHQHPGVITCGLITKDVVITCDDRGFIHRWRLDPRRV